jgi:hypothetical protein
MTFHHSPSSFGAVAFLFCERKKLRKIKVYFQHQLENALRD